MRECGSKGRVYATGYEGPDVKASFRPVVYALVPAIIGVALAALTPCAAAVHRAAVHTSAGAGVNVAGTVATAGAGGNLLSNPGFSHGAGDSPDDWRTGGWNESPAVTRYDWLHSAGSEPELIITNIRPNDARWIQSLSLGPGLYYISAEVRTEDVGSGAAGATVSLDEDGIGSSDLRGTTGWNRLGFYLRVGRHGADVEVAMRLGGFSSLNTGRAYFRDASVTKVAVPEPGIKAPVFDLSTIRKSLGSPPLGRPWTLAATLAVLTILVFVGWKMYGSDDPEPFVAPRAERRRHEGDARRKHRH